MTCACNPSALELEAGGSQIESYPWLHKALKACQKVQINRGEVGESHIMDSSPLGFLGCFLMGNERLMV